LPVENVLGEPSHSTTPSGGTANNTTASKATRLFTEYRCPDCPQVATKVYKYGKPWEDHFTNEHLEFYTLVDGNGYYCWDCFVNFRTIKKLAEHRWKLHVKTAQK
jgi:hypothetical protein